MVMPIGQVSLCFPGKLAADNAELVKEKKEPKREQARICYLAEHKCQISPRKHHRRGQVHNTWAADHSYVYIYTCPICLCLHSRTCDLYQA